MRSKMNLSNFTFLRPIFLARFFFCLFLVFLPFQLDSIVLTESIYFSGFFNPYLSQFVYISDFAFLVSVFFWFLELGFSPKVKFDFGNLIVFGMLFAIVGFYLLSLIFSEAFIVSGVYFLRIVQSLIFYLMIVNRVVSLKTIFVIFVWVMSFEALVGISQYILQQSLGLRFFGEPVLSSTELGVAKVDFLKDKFLRVYGTFPHPNVFAGYLGIALMLAIYLGKYFKKYFYYLAVVCFLALLLTFSRSAFLALLLCGGFFLYFNKVKVGKGFFIAVFLFLILLAFLGVPKIAFQRLFIDTAIVERFEYLDISRKILWSNWFGVGAGAFTSVMQEFTYSKLLPWHIQPVHNIFVLQLVELGFFGGLLFFYFFLDLFYRLFSKLKKLKDLKGRDGLFLSLALLLFIFVIGFFDHYFVSLYQGRVLLWLVFGFCGALLRSSRL